MRDDASQPDYRADNARELERMRGLVQRLTDSELLLPVNESWTVAAVLGHIAFWDGRAMALADKLSKGRPFTESDDEPEDVDWINDASRPLIHAIPARQAAELAVRIAEEADGAVAGLSADQAAQAWPMAGESPLNVLRASHRGEHLDEIEAALSR